jgi:hypothetical protein
MDADRNDSQLDPVVEKRGGHEAPDGAEVHPLIDLSRDPNPGIANHAKPENE